MKTPISAPSEVKSVKKCIMLCKKCGKIAECSVFLSETELKLYSVPIKNIHKHYFAVCPGCKGYFYLDNGDF